MERGQAEHLFPILEAHLNEASWAWRDIDAIGVGVGPGNFTGIRISVASARGLGLSLDLPVFGISGFEVQRGDRRGAILVSLPAPRNRAYVQAYLDAEAVGPPALIDPSDPPPSLMTPHAMAVHGHRADEIGAALGLAGYVEDTQPNPGRLAALIEARHLAAREWPERPVPLYIRPADAAPPREAPPVILE